MEIAYGEALGKIRPGAAATFVSVVAKLSLIEWKAHAHRRAAALGVNGEVTIQFPGPFPHAAYADAGTDTGKDRALFFGRNAGALIGDFCDDFGGRSADTNACRVAS